MNQPDGAHPSRCDDAGNCTCIAIASIGHEGVWGPCSTDNTAALQNWLNTQSTAKVDNYATTKPTLTPDFLAKYDVIILQWMVETGMKGNDGAAWQFSAAEVSALSDWVNAGGGIVALNGYQCPANGCSVVDIVATNQLLSFTDIQFVADDNFDGNNISCQNAYCWGGAVPVGAATAGCPSTLLPAPWDSTSPLGKHITDVGAWTARSIKSTMATPMFQVDSTDGTKQYAVHEQIGSGHVFAYGDEWVTYTGEWTGTSKCITDPTIFNNMNDPCYQKSAAQVFQIPQFWYNAIKYAASSVQCFTIMDAGVIQ
jgi:hypothetical protein